MIAATIGGCDDHRLDRVGCDLAQAAEFAVVYEDETAIDMQKSKRTAWIRENIVAPVTALRQALAVENAKITSPWPYYRDLDDIDQTSTDAFEEIVRMAQAKSVFRKEDAPDASGVRKKRPKLPPSRTMRQKIVADLEWLEAWAKNRLELFDAESTKPATTRRDEFVEAVVRIYATHFPELDQAGLRSSGEKTMLAKFVDAASQPVLRSTNLTAQIKRAVSIVRREAASNLQPGES